MQTLVSVHHPSPKAEIAQYFFESSTSASNRAKGLLNQDGGAQANMFDITEHSANPATFAKHILSVMDLSLEDQSILLQGQHSPLLLTQLLEGLLSLSLPF